MLRLCPKPARLALLNVLEEEEEGAVHLPPARPLMMRASLIQTMHATNYATIIAVAAAVEATRLADAQAVLKARPASARILMMATAHQKSPGASLAILTAERHALAVTEGLPEGALMIILMVTSTARPGSTMSAHRTVTIAAALLARRARCLLPQLLIPTTAWSVLPASTAPTAPCAWSAG